MVSDGLIMGMKGYFNRIEKRFLVGLLGRLKHGICFGESSRVNYNLLHFR